MKDNLGRTALFVACTTLLFAGLIDDSWYGSVVPHKLKALALVGASLRWAIVDPIGYYPAIALFVVLMSLVCGISFLAQKQGSTSAETVPVPVMAESRQPEPAEFGSSARTFGRKSAETAGSTVPLKARIDPVVQTLRAAFEDGFDWYFAHYGYEGNWIPVAAKMAASPEPELVAFAKLLKQAGHLNDELTKFRQSVSAGGMSWEESDRLIAAKEVPYMAAMRELDREKRKLLPPKEARTGTLAQLNDWL